MPFFTDLNEAQRYARNRPYFHPIAIGRAKDTAGIDRTLPLALDIACGTGQSTTALKSIASRVVGIDISFNMLINARREQRIHYAQGQAESLPFKSGAVPILSTALAFHWFQRDRFLSEAWRVLSAGGLLLVYNNGFTGIMREEPTFQQWSRGVYQDHFPTPARDSTPLTPEEAASLGFVLLDAERYENDVRFTPEELAAYLATQTNVMAAVEQGWESPESAWQWLQEQVRPYFPGPKATFVFVTRAWYLRKVGVR